MELAVIRRSEIVAALEDVRSAVRRLEGMLDDYREDGAPPVYKTPGGKLTPAGVKELKRMVHSGKSDSEIADALGISQAAVNYRRNS